MMDVTTQAIMYFIGNLLTTTRYTQLFFLFLSITRPGNAGLLRKLCMAASLIGARDVIWNESVDVGSQLELCLRVFTCMGSLHAISEGGEPRATGLGHRPACGYKLGSCRALQWTLPTL